jgi:hypothetical protein
MKSRTWRFATIALITLLVIPILLAAQDSGATAPRYVLKDLPMLGTLIAGSLQVRPRSES